MPTIAKIFLTLLALPAVISSLYLLLLTLLSARPKLPLASTGQLCFDIIVPAHNEEAGIANTVKSLLAVDWARERFRIKVVADNCSDATAQCAAEAGASVLVRENVESRGKGYALLHAFEVCMAEGWADALVVVDADSEVSANLLEAFAARLEQGESAVQVHYGVRNPTDSWRTLLIAVAKGAFHIVRSRARERLGLSCGIRGNGWCVTTKLLRDVPYRAFSLTEDVEYGIALGWAGRRVAYADEAHTNGDMVSKATIARVQRQRWEAGRFEMVRKFCLPLMKNGIATKNAVRTDLAMDLLVLPLSYGVLNILLLIIAGLLLQRVDPDARYAVWVGLACLIAIAAHVLRGWQVSGTGRRGLSALLHVPGYMIWKIWTVLGRRTTGWVRTEREIK